MTLEQTECILLAHKRDSLSTHSSSSILFLSFKQIQSMLNCVHFFFVKDCDAIVPATLNIQYGFHCTGLAFPAGALHTLCHLCGSRRICSPVAVRGEQLALRFRGTVTPKEAGRSLLKAGTARPALLGRPTCLSLPRSLPAGAEERSRQAEKVEERRVRLKKAVARGVCGNGRCVGQRRGAHAHFGRSGGVGGGGGALRGLCVQVSLRK